MSLLSTLRGNISFWRENVALLHLQSIPTTFGLEWKHSLGLLQQQLYAPFCSMYEAGHGGSHFQPQHSGARQIFQFQIRLVYIVSWFQAKQGYTGQTKAIPEWVSRPPQYFAWKRQTQRVVQAVAVKNSRRTGRKFESMNRSELVKAWGQKCRLWSAETFQQG